MFWLLDTMVVVANEPTRRCGFLRVCSSGFTDGSQNRESRCDLTGVLIRAYYAHRKEDAMQRKARLGRPPKPARLRKTRRLQLLLTPAEHQRLAKYAMERDSTVSEVIRACIRSLVGQGGGAD